ncbi:MAG: hypothetical protein QF863_07085, partial [Pseudomonadales bacterium]|nr:hypothetical protein [Pseudomonadales bacterium]
MALQVALISAAVAAGIYITNTIIEDFLITEALENEAAHFWQLYQENPNQPLPNTANMRGYLVESPASDFQEAVQTRSTLDHRAPPAQMLVHPTGFMGRVTLGQETPTLFVSAQPTGDGPTLYLTFASEDVSQLAFYFGILPLAMALLLV